MTYFREALALARSDAVKARVEKASLCAYRAAVSASSLSLVYSNGVCRPNLEGFEPALLERYAALCERFGVTMDDEQVTTSGYVETMRRLYAGLKALQVENDYWRVVVLPESNAKVVEMTYKPTGRNVVRAPRAFNRFRYEEWVIRGDGPGSDSIAAYEAQGEPQKIRLSLTAKDGARLQRTISLAGNAVRFETTLTADAPRAFDLLVHPEYDAATTSVDPGVLGIYVKTPDWAQANRGWKGGMPAEEQRSALTEAVGGGAFAYFNKQAGFGIEQRFEPRDFSALRLFWDGSRRQINLGLASKALWLEKGQHAGYAYEVHYLGKAPPVQQPRRGR